MMQFDKQIGDDKCREEVKEATNKLRNEVVPSLAEQFLIMGKGALLIEGTVRNEFFYIYLQFLLYIFRLN